MTGVLARPMRWWDIPAVMTIEESVFPDTAWTAAQFWSELAHDDRTYLVVEETERVVAYGGVMVRKPTADVQTIAVDPGFRGRGIARDLLGRLLRVAEDKGCTEILLEVGAGNFAAIALYASERFEIVSRRKAYYGPGQDALIMRRRDS